MVKVVIDDTQPKQRVVVTDNDKKITVNSTQPKEKVVTGTVEKNVVIDPGQEKQRVVTKEGTKGDIGPQGLTGPQGPIGPAGADGSDGAISIVDVDTLELEMEFILSNLTNFKETIFTDGLLTNLSTYTTPIKTTKLFNKDFTYVAGQLTQLVLTRVSDSATLTKEFTYNIDGTLKTINTI